ncbi:uncharacterized protein LOC141657179 [Silene latifolia]|uniref:uncharacterized protein LOC141657179 n=1 Tax=Silene latifolia TaxID=37657 RepID=UPI003D77CB92
MPQHLSYQHPVDVGLSSTSPPAGPLGSTCSSSGSDVLPDVVPSGMARPLPIFGGTAGAPVHFGSYTHLASIEENLSIEFDLQGPPNRELLKLSSDLSDCNQIVCSGHLGQLGPGHGIESSRTTAEHFGVEPQPTPRVPKPRSVCKGRGLDRPDDLPSPFLLPSNMNILYWNCRGIARPSFRTHLSYLINAHNPTIVILSETRVRSPNSLAIVRRLPFDSFEILDPVGFTCGIIILWNAGKTTVSLLNKTDQLINVVVQVPNISFLFFLSAVYASPKFRLRKILWSDLINIAASHDLPWVCLGDFNEVTCSTDKIGGRGIKLNRVNLFKSSLDSCNLIDIGFSGPKFTWTNRRRINPILERLDRVWVNQAWMDQYPNSHNYHRPVSPPRPLCPIMLKTSLPHHPSVKAFKFETFWTCDPSFYPLVAHTWPSLTNSIPSKLSNLSLTITDWAKVIFGDLPSRKRRLSARLLGVQRNLCTHPNSDSLLTLNDSLTQELNCVLDLEHFYWKDRSRIRWLTDGDRNTAFFQKSVTIRRSFNRILSLTNNAGLTISGHDELNKHISTYFTDLFTSGKEIAYLVPPVNLPSSGSPFTSTFLIPSSEEIRTAIFSLGSGKAPGPDGFHAGFFKKCWEIIKADFIPFIQNIFHSKTIPAAINLTSISLIPKIPSPQSITNFRPISLCNTTYKTVTKILVNRLKPFMHSLISPNQGSSIPGRGTDANFIIASEILHSMHTSKSKLGWFALKLDLEKAFDRLEWDFVRTCLIAVNIDPETISLIMSCISTTSAFVTFNGTPLDTFTPSRGIRQGDPLSPYLFIICMEALSRLIHQACNNSDWIPFPLGKGGVSFSHLLFADDILVFGRTSERNLCALQDTILSFCSDSGQKINCSKSKITFSKLTPPSEATLFEDALGIKKTNTLGTYLGFPLLSKKPKRSDLNFILDNIKSKLASWKSKFLSRAGRICLIKSTINAIPNHAMQCIRLPSSILRDIDKTTRSFLWSSQSANKLHLANWDLVTLPLSLGGLGIKAAEPLNDALSTKLCSKVLLNNSSSAAKTIHSKYCTPSRHSFSRGSHIWKNIGRGWNILKDHLLWSIGDGSTISLWDDPWLDLGPLRTLVLGPLSLSSSSAKLNSIISNGVWALDSLEFVLPDLITIAILSTPIPTTPRPDVLSTSLAPKGKFSISDAYSSLCHPNPTPALPTFPADLSWLWDIPTQPRIKVFLWLVWWNKLPHKASLFGRKILPSSSCSLCPNPSISETSLHALRDCSFASHSWSILNDSPHLKLVFEKRSANRVADAIAHHSISDSSDLLGCFEWDLPPPFVVDLCMSDSVMLCHHWQSLVVEISAGMLLFHIPLVWDQAATTLSNGGDKVVAQCGSVCDLNDGYIWPSDPEESGDYVKNYLLDSDYSGNFQLPEIQKSVESIGQN